MRKHIFIPLKYDSMPLNQKYEDDECLFCRMVNKEEPCDIVMESTRYIAIYYTVSRHIGHTLVFPKKHRHRYEDIKNKHYFFKFVDDVHTEISEIYEPDSTMIKINNGNEVGQLVPHICCHIIPYYES